MQFNSLTFIIFFVVVLLVFQLLPGWRLQKSWLLLTSYFFYAAWNPPFVLLLFFSTIIDWFLARKMFFISDLKRKRVLLGLSLLSNLGILGFFKYGNFALDQFSVLVTSLGVDYHPAKLDIILPVGISFYTFQTLSYTLDAYRGKIAKPAGFLDFAVFVSFFPQLVAGPIVRAHDFLPQLERPRRLRADSLSYGFAILIIGLFQKTVLADAIFAPVVDPVFTQPELYGSLSTWIAVLGFSGQIFYDFSGYTLCAIGAALCMGFHIPDNFRSPYAAAGFSDFWHRWHISLSTWLRDYLYISLGGNRRGGWFTYLNLMLTMLIGGLWHGASWMFVIWGGLHGIYLCIEKSLIRPGWFRRIPLEIKALLTFILVSLTWIPFRAANLSVSGAILRRLFVITEGSSLDISAMFWCCVAISGTFYWQFTQRHATLEDRLGAWPSKRIALCLGFALIAIYLVSGGDERAFIYFQF